jgi:ABC-type uncharacterized transport system auxiliary subunit
MRMQSLSFVAFCLALLAGCVEGQKPTPLKRFDTEAHPEVQKKDREVPPDKAKVGARA